MTDQAATPTPLDLQLCETCRKHPARGGHCDSPKQLVAAAQQWAKARGRTVNISLVSCLSGCAVGHTAMIENSDASVRLHSLPHSADLIAILNDADGLLAGTPTPSTKRHQLSRTDWAMWRD
jgi:predicted metal-binding protein